MNRFVANLSGLCLKVGGDVAETESLLLVSSHCSCEGYSGVLGEGQKASEVQREWRMDQRGGER